jgi:hypothetical protein
MIVAAMIVGLCAIWCAVGFALCSVRHRQRGIEVDDVGVPDYVPPSWDRVSR